MEHSGEDMYFDFLFICLKRLKINIFGFLKLLMRQVCYSVMLHSMPESVLYVCGADCCLLTHSVINAPITQYCNKNH